MSDEKELNKQIRGAIDDLLFQAVRLNVHESLQTIVNDIHVKPKQNTAAGADFTSAIGKILFRRLRAQASHEFQCEHVVHADAFEEENAAATDAPRDVHEREGEDGVMAESLASMSLSSGHRRKTKQVKEWRPLDRPQTTERCVWLSEEMTSSSGGCSDAIPSDEGKTVMENGICVLTESEFGTKRVTAFQNATELCNRLIECLHDTDSRSIIADIRVDSFGSLVICSHAHMQKQRIFGSLFCADCGLFFRGNRGLRNHQSAAHQRDYESSMEKVAESQMQLIAYSCDRRQVNEWEDESARERSARDNLGDDGLEAAKAGDLETLKALVASGWNVNEAKDRHGSNALCWAAGGGHVHVCEYLTEHCHLPAIEMTGPHRKRKRNALHWAARNGHLSTVQWLVNVKHIPIDLGTSDGTTPFMYAVWQGHLHVCRWMVEAGQCNFRATNSFGCNAIQWCTQTGDVPMCEYLQSIGLDLQLHNRNGHSALHKAAVKGQREVCEWLLSKGGLGAKHMNPDLDGNWPSTLASGEGFNELSEWLRGREKALGAPSEPWSPANNQS